MWVDGSDLQWENWHISEPNNWEGVDETVAFMNLVHPDFATVVDGTWYDSPENSNEYVYALCEKAIPTSTTTLPPTYPTSNPTGRPVVNPTSYSSSRPSPRPTLPPSPTRRPSVYPTSHPSPSPSDAPTPVPTKPPTPNPTTTPTRPPSDDPTWNPSPMPTNVPSRSPTRTPSRTPTGCPTAIQPDWTCLGESCYKRSPVTSHWPDAISYCAAEDALLTIISSAAENEFVLGVCGSVSCWIGLQELQDEDEDSDNFGSEEWVWVDGSDLLWENWHTSQPDNW